MAIALGRAAQLLAQAQPQIHLTPTELRVVKAFIRVGPGYGGGKVAAATLGMCVNTFQVHTKNIADKMGVPTYGIAHQTRELGLVESQRLT